MNVSNLYTEIMIFDLMALLSDIICFIVYRRTKTYQTPLVM